MSHMKLAGHLPLQDLIANVIDRARMKTAADESKDEKAKEKKLIAYEKREHGGKVPSVKEEEAEKKASANVINPFDPEEIEKLASALESVGEKLASDSVELGGESKQGGEVLATMAKVPGKQPYKKDAAKHQVPTSTGLQKAEVGAATQVPNDHAKAPGGAAYPAKGVFKTAGQGVMAKIQAAASKTAEQGEEKQASAVDFLLGKIAESTQGGEVLTDDLPKNKATPPSLPGKEMIQSNAAVVSATKAKAKAPQKKLLSQVLTEPAQTKATDSKVHENLRNASKGGVKIAAARVLLQKIAEEGCQCSGKGECKYCKLQAAKKAQSEKK